MARVSHLVSLIGFCTAGTLALCMIWRIIRTPARPDKALQKAVARVGRVLVRIGHDRVRGAHCLLPELVSGFVGTMCARFRGVAFGFFGGVQAAAGRRFGVMACW
jgi:hypothetical protein